MIQLSACIEWAVAGALIQRIFDEFGKEMPNSVMPYIRALFVIEIVQISE
jgi:hypothetical protein